MFKSQSYFLNIWDVYDDKNNSSSSEELEKNLKNLITHNFTNQDNFW
jgi:hypothetical protein